MPQVYQVDFDRDASNVVNLNNSTIIVQPFKANEIAVIVQ
jgi:hypothetical protein